MHNVYYGKKLPQNLLHLCNVKKPPKVNTVNRRKFAQSGTDVMILKIFSPNFLAKKLAFFGPTRTNFSKKLIITLVFEKTPIFSQKIGKNRRKL
jgi:hypothetical protein